MNNRQVAKNFANGHDSHTKNMFAESNIIYSYGYHFPIAYKSGYYINGKRIVFFNDNDYSNTTGRHKSHTEGALNSQDYIVVKTRNIKDVIFELKGTGLTRETKRKINAEIDKRFDDLRGKEKRSRVHKELYRELQEMEANQARAFNTIAYAA